MSLKPRILLIDHYDSFTYTIKSYFDCLGAHTEVIQFDSDNMLNIKAFYPSHLVLSPGPGSPSEVPATLNLIEKYYTTYPMLGICLGHQCIAHAFGGRITHAGVVMHGKQSLIEHNGTRLFTDIPSSFSVTRYHSLSVDEASLPAELSITAWVHDAGKKRVIMALEHSEYPVFGVQYHPEAIMTEHGLLLLKNFLKQSI